MTAPLTFGFTPTPGVLVLSRYSDFVTELISNTGSWPVGTGLEFHFTPANTAATVVWAATVSGATATWDVPATSVAALLDGGTTTYRLFYLQGSNTLEWSSGPIQDAS